MQITKQRYGDAFQDCGGHSGEAPRSNFTRLRLRFTEFQI